MARSDVSKPFYENCLAQGFVLFGLQVTVRLLVLLVLLLCTAMFNVGCTTVHIASKSQVLISSSDAWTLYSFPSPYMLAPVG